MTAPIQERIQKSESLGREFLIWLWFKSETSEGRFDLGEGGQAELWFDRRVVLQSENDHGVEKVVCTGESPHLREARFALTKNKEVTEAMIRLTMDNNEWSFVLDSTWMNFKSFKVPKIKQDVEEDPEGFFYEKMFLVEQAVSAMDAIFATFVSLRFSEDWEAGELPALRQWIRQGQ